MIATILLAMLLTVNDTDASLFVRTDSLQVQEFFTY